MKTYLPVVKKRAGKYDKGKDNMSVADDKYEPIDKKLSGSSTIKDDIIKGLTNFTMLEFHTLWTQVCDVVMVNMKSGLGKPSKIYPMDAFLITFAKFKMGMTYANTAQMFGLHTNQVCCCFLKFLER